MESKAFIAYQKSEPAASLNLYDAALIAVWGTDFMAARALLRTRAPRTGVRFLSTLRGRGQEVRTLSKSRYKTVSILPSVSAIARPARREHGRGEGSRVRPLPPTSCVSCSHPPLGRDNGIHLLEEELLKRYLKRRLLPNGHVLRRTGC